MKQDKTVGLGLFVIRLGLGLVILYYGCQKMFGLFGGPGFSGTLQFMHDRMGIRPAFAALAIFAEFCGGLGLVVGLLTRVAAFGVMCTMAVATYEGVSAPGALSSLMRGDPTTPPHILYPAALCVFALGIFLMGAGPISLDNRLFGAGRRKSPAK